MTSLAQFDIATITPEQSTVLSHQGLPERAVPSSSIKQLMNAAYSEFEQLCQPAGLSKAIGVNDFPQILNGEHQNHPDAPLYQIYPQARQLIFFVLTMGPQLSTRIAELFRQEQFALGAMLDSVVSMAADKAAEVMENQVAQEYCGTDDAALAYSPGYCGWHISGQKKLFHYMNPGELGVTINSSYLMTPVKSVSGVIISGPARIHQFVPKFKFCKECHTKSCVERIAELQLD